MAAPFVLACLKFSRLPPRWAAVPDSQIDISIDISVACELAWSLLLCSMSR
jgi:hypothetical protein